MLSRYSSKEEPFEMELTTGLPETELFSGLTVTKVTSELPEKSLNFKPPARDRANLRVLPHPLSHIHPQDGPVEDAQLKQEIIWISMYRSVIF